MGIRRAFDRVVEAINAVDNKLKNISVGGRNLLSNTQNPNYYRWANRGALSGTRLTIDTTDSNTSVGIFTSHHNLDLKQGQDYVISFDVDTDLDSLNYNYILEDGGNIRLSSSSIKQGRVVIQYTPDRNLNNIRLLVGGYSGTKTNYLDVKKIKIEKGTIPTDYTPALEDFGAWQLITTTTDLNTLTETGKYFLQASSNPNSPNTTWRYYVVVERISETRITQTIWQETNASLIYRRLWVDNKWTGWEQEITNAQFIAKLNGTWLGGRNYLLNSQQTRTEHGTTNLAVSPNVDLSLVRHLTLSVDVDCVNVRRTTQSGAKWFRIGAEVRIIYTDNSTPFYFGVWHNPPTTGTNSRFGRINNRFTVPTGKTIKTIDACTIQIWDIAGDKMVVKNPKLELGHLMSDWTPAHEDTQSELEALRAEVAELKRRVGANENGGGSFGD